MTTLNPTGWLMYLHGDVNDDSMSDIMRRIDEGLAKADVAEMWLVITSGGGRIDAGLGLYDYVLRARKTKPVYTVAAGHCASMATVILQAGTRRYATPNTSIMIHPASYNVNGKVQSDSGELLEEARFSADQARRTMSIMAKHVGLRVREYEKQQGAIRRLWASQALAFGSKGLIDEIIK